jgi:hypothetical protein
MAKKKEKSQSLRDRKQRRHQNKLLFSRLLLLWYQKNDSLQIHPFKTNRHPGIQFFKSLKQGISLKTFGFCTMTMRLLKHRLQQKYAFPNDNV